MLVGFNLKLDSGLNFGHDAGRFLQLLGFSFSQNLLDDVRDAVPAEDAWQ